MHHGDAFSALSGATEGVHQGPTPVHDFQSRRFESDSENLKSSRGTCVSTDRSATAAETRQTVLLVDESRVVGYLALGQLQRRPGSTTDPQHDHEARHR